MSPAVAEIQRLVAELLELGGLDAVSPETQERLRDVIVAGELELVRHHMAAGLRSQRCAPRPVGATPRHTQDGPVRRFDEDRAPPRAHARLLGREERAP